MLGEAPDLGRFRFADAGPGCVLVPALAAQAKSAKRMTVTQATFIGVGSMVGAGIFALLGSAGAVAGAAVWLSFLIAGIIAALQGVASEEAETA